MVDVASRPICDGKSSSVLSQRLKPGRGARLLFAVLKYSSCHLLFPPFLQGAIGWWATSYWCQCRVGHPAQAALFGSHALCQGQMQQPLAPCLCRSLLSFCRFRAEEAALKWSLLHIEQCLPRWETCLGAGAAWHLDNMNNLYHYTVFLKCQL